MLTLEDDILPLAFVDDKKELRFDPPVYQQRYSAVLQVLRHPLWQNRIKKVVEFGCAEMSFLRILKNVSGVEHILQVDIDEEVLKKYRCCCQPLMVDYIKNRENPLKIDVYKGSIAEPDDCLIGTHAVIGIEIIEHLHADELQEIPFNIFGFIKPIIGIFTTPNIEFNVLFPSLIGLRHWDHKFEWTREQFKDWSANICERFPDYNVSFFDIGPGPDGSSHLGCVSQMAVFMRKDFAKDEKIDFSGNPSSLVPDTSTFGNYNHLFGTQFPFYVDDRTKEQQILNETTQIIERIKYYNHEEYINYESYCYHIPLKEIFSQMNEMQPDLNEFRVLLRANGYELSEDDIVIVNYADTESDGSDNDEDE